MNSPLRPPCEGLIDWITGPCARASARNATTSTMHEPLLAPRRRRGVDIVTRRPILQAMFHTVCMNVCLRNDVTRNDGKSSQDNDFFNLMLNRTNAMRVELIRKYPSPTNMLRQRRPVSHEQVIRRHSQSSLPKCWRWFTESHDGSLEQAAAYWQHCLAVVLSHC